MDFQPFWRWSRRVAISPIVGLATTGFARSSCGKQGVLFESLGDFIHPNLDGDPDNFIGRVLFDLETLEVRQVPAIPIFVDGAIVSLSSAANPMQLPSSQGWQIVEDPSGWGQVRRNARSAYFKVP